ncbi:MAG: MaoC family dehydratase N-terminal domain-containing protein [Rhodoglobus sp.]
MGIAKSAIGRRMPPITATIERGRLMFFAEAIGETNPLYTDVTVARAAGHPDLPVPPTFLFGLLLEGPDALGWMHEVGIDLRYLLHGNEAFTYHSMAHAGDTLTFSPVITDVFEKRGGALEFLSRESAVTRPDGTPVATLTEMIVVRHPELETT